MGYLRLGKDNWARTTPTKEGIVFLGLSLFVGFAALNTGNNLLYLAFGMMLSFIVASGVMSMINIARIEVSIKGAGDTFAEKSSRLKFTLKNQKYLIPTYSISIELGDERVFIPYLPANKEQEVAVPHLFSKRGWNKIPGARLSTRYPFGFFKKWIKIDTDEESVLVYPRTQSVSIDKECLNRREDDNRAQAGEKHGRTGSGEDIRSIKEYISGDNPRLIHWKSTAKKGKFMVRETEEESDRKEAVLEFIPESERSLLERQISLLASTFLELKKRGVAVEFRAPDRTFNSEQLGRSPRAVLTYLALFEI